MRALITGGTGFVGSHIVRQLNERGIAVRVLHRASSRMDALAGCAFESALGDVTELDAVRAACAECDWVFHVAAVADYWRADRDRMFQVNVDGTRLVLQAAREAGVQRVMFTSSAAAVGLRDDRPAREDEPFNLPIAHFPYGYSKVQAEAVVTEAVALGQDVVTLNPAVIMGPGDLNLISGSFVVQMAQWQWLTPATHGGIAVIDVRDVAEGHLVAAERGRTGERYILNHENFTYRQWFRLIAETIGVAAPIFYTPGFILPGMARLIDGLRAIGIQTPVDANQVRLGGRFVYFDASKAHAEFGPPRISLRQSVRDTYDWYVAQGIIKPSVTSRLLGRIARLAGHRPATHYEHSA